MNIQKKVEQTKTLFGSDNIVYLVNGLFSLLTVVANAFSRAQMMTHVEMPDTLCWKHVQKML